MMTMMMRSDEVSPLVVVVDMQKYYDFRKQTLQAVQKLLSVSVARGGAVVFLEHWQSGDTDCLLLDEVAEYPHFERVSKQGRDGGAEVLEAAVRRGFALEHVYVCGVYIDQCVAATTRTLSERLPDSRIVVHKEACEGQAGRSTSWSWMMFPARSNNVELREWYPYNRAPETHSSRQATTRCGRLHLELFAEKFECQRVARAIAELKQKVENRSLLEQEYIGRLCFWVETSLLRARQFVDQAERLRSVVANQAAHIGGAHDAAIACAPDLLVAGAPIDSTDLLQIALDDIEHARMALLRCRDYLVMARQVLD